jgi:hypothetical protein
MEGVAEGVEGGSRMWRGWNVTELRAEAKGRGLKGYSKLVDLLGTYWRPE